MFPVTLGRARVGKGIGREETRPEGDGMGRTIYNPGGERRGRRRDGMGWEGMGRGGMGGGAICLIVKKKKTSGRNLENKYVAAKRNFLHSDSWLLQAAGILVLR